MKRIFITSVVALALILGSVVAAQALSGYTFSSYLKVGSTGADVSALQNFLMGAGFDIPSISSGAAQTGYFGQQTKAAVVKYQGSVGLPTTGFVGPLTVAKLNGTSGAVASGAVVCPVGYTCTATPGASTPVVAGTGTITTPGVGGSLAISLQATPSNGTSLSKGQEADVVTYKLQAGSSDMSLSSMYLDFNNRLWLYASSVTVLDGSTVIARKDNLTANDFTELTVGSNYRLNVPIVGYVVPKAATRYLTVHLKMLPVSDRSSATVSITQLQTRAVDGTGVTDTQTLASTRTFSYTGSNNGQIVVTLNASSPLQSLVQISQAAQTDNVLLAKYDVKSQNISGTLRSLTLGLHTQNVGLTALFGDVKISVNGHTYSADTIASTSGSWDGTATFTNLNEVLPADQYVTVSVYGKINQDTNGTLLTGASASTTLAASGTAGGTSNNPSIEDASYSALAVNSNTVAASTLNFSSSSATLTSMSATLGTVTNGNVGGVSVATAQSVSFTFTMTAGNNTLYMSAVPSTALGTTTTGYASNTNASTTISDVTANPGTIAGDVAGSYFVIPAGSSRTFVWNGTVKYEVATGQILRTFKISRVNYGTSSSALTANNITYNLDALKVSPTI